MREDLQLLVDCLPVSRYRDILSMKFEELSVYPNWFGNWIVQYDEEVFVAFDPTTDGANIVGAFRSFYEAENYLQCYMEHV